MPQQLGIRIHHPRPPSARALHRRDLDLASLLLFHMVESLVHAAVIDGNAASATDVLEQEICTVVWRYLGVGLSQTGL
ncbi:MAG: hypothetical protein V4858_06755 [Pseudomonadota bacterium]